jgi:hypothetical protein
MLWAAVALGILIVALGVTAWAVARHFQPFVRDQATRYLEDRFGTGVELGAFHVSVTVGSVWKLETAVLRVAGTNLILPYPHEAGLPPLISAGKFRLDAGLSALWSPHPRIHQIRVEQVKINIPPREQRAATTSNAAGAPKSLSLGAIQASDVQLNIYPADPAKPPRTFHIHTLQFTGGGEGRPMKYRAELTNPTPPGLIQASGDFGPWHKDDPGLTPLSGDYRFEHADLGVFHRIAGTLDSTGKFGGVLRRLEVDGETRTPNFRLTGGNPVPLTTRYHSIVDGTSGDTLLQPVNATLGRSHLIARGGVTRPPGAARRTVTLDVVLDRGHIEDLLRLAVKSPQPLMTGDVELHTRMQILPLAEALSLRLLLTGSFDMDQTHFNGASVQDKIDSLSRRAQGQPKNEEISNVLSAMRGDFSLQDGALTLSSLTFQVPGAAVHLKGGYNLDSEQIDMRGVARLRAKVSQTMTGWKRLVLRPVDPFLSKGGAGTLLPIKITGTRENPQFGLDRGSKKDTPQGRPNGR